MADFVLAHSIHIFAGDYESALPKLKALDAYLDSPKSFVNVYRPRKGVEAATVYGFKETRHIDADPRDPNINPFFVSGDGVLTTRQVRLTDMGPSSLSVLLDCLCVAAYRVGH